MLVLWLLLLLLLMVSVSGEAQFCPNSTHHLLHNETLLSLPLDGTIVQASLSCSSQPTTLRPTLLVYFTPTANGVWSLRANLACDGVMEIRKSCSRQIIACNDDWSYSHAGNSTGFHGVYLEAGQEYGLYIGAWDTSVDLVDGGVGELLIQFGSTSFTKPQASPTNTNRTPAPFPGAAVVEATEQEFPIALVAGSVGGAMAALLGVAMMVFAVKKMRRNVPINAPTSVAAECDAENPRTRNRHRHLTVVNTPI